MNSDKPTESYICSSADWDCLIEKASSPIEAAALAMQKQVDSETQTFSVGATISVVPVILKKKEAQYIYSPSVLADIGLHRFAGDLSKNLDRQIEEKKNSKKKKGSNNEGKS